MRVSIWRQFSSNHSNSFDLVAKFPTPEQAQQVAEQLRADLQTIADYWKGLSQEEKTQLHSGDEITPPEIKLYEKYGVWAFWSDNELRGLDWLDDKEENFRDAVHTYQSVIFMNNTYQTMMGPEPFQFILAKLGGQVAYNTEMGGQDIFWDVSFDLPDEEQANAVFGRLQTMLVEENGFIVTGYGHVRQQGTHIEMNVWLDWPIHESFAVLWNFLQSQGAQNIQYSAKGEES